MEITPAEFSKKETLTTAIPQNCLEKPNAASRSGSPCILGTYEIHYDVTTTISNHETNHTVSPLTVKFSLWAVSPGTLAGQAHLIYSLKNTLLDTQSSSCPVQTELVNNLEWDVDLSGEYSKPADNQYRIVFLADPNQGPAYTGIFEGCPIPDRQEPGITWPGASGLLVDGEYNFNQDLLPANSSGEDRLILHMELVH